MTTVLAGHAAPDFTLHDASGKTVSLADALKKGPVVAAFFKITCPVCQFTFPFLERLHKAYGTDGATFLGISQDDVADTKDFLFEYRVTFPAAIDDDGYPASNAYGLTTVPTVFLIAPDGKVLVSSVGFAKNDLEQISAEIGKHLKREPAPLFMPGEVVPESKPG
jgi:peroxiredoxin